jgi:hypothetical protein
MSQLFKQKTLTLNCCWSKGNNVLLVMLAPSTETGHIYKVLAEILSQIVKKRRSRCSH